ncbi:MAG: transglycosylase SLT domain-containing protein [Bdellovibrionales bacterium]|nr:transglycosylase SLT domain-containing protein [Bdellovibrionales bacterium]
MVKKKIKKKTTTVRAHPMEVPVSEKNPTGVTIRDQHLRRLPGTYLKREDIGEIFKSHNRKDITYPTAGKISEHKTADDYDELIAVWTNYFNTKLKTDPSLDPDVFKALLASESGFRIHTPENKIAFGIAQMTKQTWTVLQDPKGEAKEFIFNNIRHKDLKDPSIAIPMGIRWLMYKSNRAAAKLGRQPTHEEIILEYKGLLKSKSQYKKDALDSYRKYYGKLKGK